MEWGKSNKDPSSVDPAALTPDYYQKVQIFISEKYLGFFMVPDTSIWNYNFMRIIFASDIKCNLMLANPVDFYNEIHRPSQFLNFTPTDEEETEAVDKEDLFE
jgi:pre-mRNA-processing factor 8